MIKIKLQDILFFTISIIGLLFILQGCTSAIKGKEIFRNTAGDKRHGVFKINYEELIRCVDENPQTPRKGYDERFHEQTIIYDKLGIGEYKITMGDSYDLLVEFKRLSENETEVFVFVNPGVFGMDGFHKRGGVTEKLWQIINSCAGKGRTWEE